jgi:hypothetical protein
MIIIMMMIIIYYNYSCCLDISKLFDLILVMNKTFYELLRMLTTRKLIKTFDTFIYIYFL